MVIFNKIVKPFWSYVNISIKKVLVTVPTLEMNKDDVNVALYFLMYDLSKVQITIEDQDDVSSFNYSFFFSVSFTQGQPFC